MKVLVSVLFFGLIFLSDAGRGNSARHSKSINWAQVIREKKASYSKPIKYQNIKQIETLSKSHKQANDILSTQYNKTDDRKVLSNPIIDLNKSSLISLSNPTTAFISTDYTTIATTTYKTLGSKNFYKRTGEVYDDSYFENTDYEYVDTESDDWKSKLKLPQPLVPGKPDKFQRRTLDFLYHKFVEPRIHKNIKPRPSLLEELFQTFEQHVSKDLEAWASSGKKQESSSSSSAVYVASPDEDETGSLPDSIIQVTPGKNDDTFIVTDELGKEHTVLIEEIISSLANMDEKEVTALLLGPPIENNYNNVDRSSNIDPIFIDNVNANKDPVRTYINKDQLVLKWPFHHISSNVEKSTRNPLSTHAISKNNLNKQFISPPSGLPFNSFTPLSKRITTTPSPNNNYNNKIESLLNLKNKFIETPNRRAVKVGTKQNNLEQVVQELKSKLDKGDQKDQVYMLKSKNDEENDVFVVHDENGEIQIVTVDNIIQSLSNLDSELLAEIFKDDALLSKGNFLLTSINKKSPSLEVLPSQLTQLSSQKVPVNNVTPKNPAFIGLHDMLNLHKPISKLPHATGNNKKPTFKDNQENSMLGIQSISLSDLLSNNENNKYEKQKPIPQPKSNLELIRHSLFEARQKQFQSQILPTDSAPNLPPLKVVHATLPRKPQLPIQNIISIQPPTTQAPRNTGIKGMVSNLFSKLIGTNKDANASYHPNNDDQFVKIVMPKSNSNRMEQITIPLPKPIHKEMDPPITPPTTTTTRIPNRILSLLNFPKQTTEEPWRRSGKSNPKQKYGTSTAELILKTANIPETVRKSLLTQMNDVPTLKLPSAKQDQQISIDRSDAQDPAEDRIFFGGKEDKNAKRFKGYVYNFPPPEYVYHPIPPEPPSVYSSNYFAKNNPYYPQPKPSPYQSNSHTHFNHPSSLPNQSYRPSSSQFSDNGDQPLVDISFLADFTTVSKIGDENKSFSLPKIGDSSKFVNIRTGGYF